MGYLATPYEPGQHRAGLERLWREDFDPNISAPEERMHWLYEANPEGPATTFVSVVDQARDPVGCATYVPRKLFIDGQPLHAGISCDFAVNRKNRIAGAAITLQHGLVARSRSSGFPFLYGTPNTAARSIYKRIGYEPVGRVTTWIKPLKSGYKLSSLPSRGLAKAASTIIDAGLAAFDRVLSPLLSRGLLVEELEVPDERFDRLWRRACPTRGIIGERTSAYLAWRYGSGAPGRYSFVCLRRPNDSEIIAYAIYEIENARAVLKDIFAEDFEGPCDALLIELARRLRERNVWSLEVSYLGPSSFGARLRRLGFFERAAGREMLVCMDPSLPAPMRRTVLAPDNWFLLEGELDI
jgi:Acetyltransferase (GNAT) domain